MAEMSVLQAFEQIPDPVRGEGFVVTVQRTQQDASLEFEGYFSRSEASTYANFDPMMLVAGSQDPDPEMARVKALFRLVTMIELRLNAYKSDESDYRGLFEEEVSSEIWERFTGYAKKRFSDLNEKANSQLIPVYSENFSREKEGVFEIRFQQRSAVRNIAELQKIYLEKHQDVSDKFPRVVIKAQSGGDPYSYNISIPGSERYAS